MAYATSNPPALSSQQVGGTGKQWVYKDGDTLNTVIAADYISNGDALGMTAGDSVLFIDTTNNVLHNLAVSSVTTDGAATLGMAVGAMGPAVSLTAATYSPTVLESGTTFLLNRAAGITITLPAPVVGCRFRFTVQTAVTSNDYGIDTDGASTFMLGVIQQVIAASAVSEGQVADGTSIVSYNQNGSTTGGLVGSYVDFVAVSSTVWEVTGISVGSGTLATGFA